MISSLVKLVRAFARGDEYLVPEVVFERQRTYTREQIHAAVGGDTWSYLPVSGGRVVAGCFRTDLNPGAPEVVLPGKGDKIEKNAEILAAQIEPIPVFIKDGPNRWRFVGDYRCVGLSRDPEEIEALATKAKRHDVTCVLRLERVPADIVIRRPTAADVTAWDELRHTVAADRIGCFAKHSRVVEMWEKERYGLFIVEEHRSRTAVGIAGLVEPYRCDGPQLLCAIAPGWRRRSFALEACRQVLAWAADHRLRVFAHVDPGYEPGLRLAQSLGGRRTTPGEGYPADDAIDYVFP